MTIRTMSQTVGVFLDRHPAELYGMIDAGSKLSRDDEAVESLKSQLNKELYLNWLNE